MATGAFNGGSGDDILFGEDGDDTVTGRAGDDTLAAGAGNDSVIGSTGNDTLYGEDGNDVIKGEDGNDIAFGGAGIDIVRGHAGSDQLHGGAGDDTLEGYDGDDTLWGGDGHDTLQGGTGADIFHAGTDGIADLIVDYSAAENDMLADGSSWSVSGGDTLIFDDDGTVLFRLKDYDGTANGLLFADGPVDGPGDGATAEPPTAPEIDEGSGTTSGTGTNSDNFDLTDWKITLPVDGDGDTDGTAVEVPNLLGYEESTYFYNTADGAMVFYAPVDGATTKGSKYPRSELREMDGGDRAAWSLDQGGTMTATLAVNKVPTKNGGEPGRIIVGQIHGSKDELVRLYYEDGSLYFMNEQAGPNNDELKFTLKNDAGQQPSVTLNETFSYLIDAQDDTLTVKVFADGEVYSSVTSINDVWQSDTFYFKAGVYLGVNDDTGSGAGQVAFYGLDFGHTSGSGLGGLVDVVDDVVEEEPDGSNNGNEETPPPTEEPDNSEPDSNAGGTSDTTAGGDTVDVLDGDSGSNVLNGEGGDDTISGRGGDDTLNGGDGRDSVIGNAGNDLLHGDAGDDVIKGGNGDDTAYGDAGADVVRGHDGNDQLHGGDGDDKLEGYDGNDTLWGGDGVDTLQGGAGADTFHAGTDGVADRIVDYSAAENDQLADGMRWEVSGGDTLVYDDAGTLLFRLVDYDAASAGIHLLQGDATGPSDPPPANDEPAEEQPDGSAGEEEPSGGEEPTGGETPVETDPPVGGGDEPAIEPGAGAVVGDDGANYLDGGSGADTLFGDGGNDTVTGRAGDDVVSGGDGDDSVIGSSGNDTLFGDAGDDVIKGEGDDDIAYGGAGRDIVRGHAGDDQLHGGADDDKLEGYDGNDTLWGDDGLDTLQGGSGADTFHAGSDGIADLVVDYAAGENDVLVGGVTWATVGGDTIVYDVGGTAIFRLEDYDAGSQGIHFA